MNTPPMAPLEAPQQETSSVRARPCVLPWLMTRPAAYDPGGKLPEPDRLVEEMEPLTEFRTVLPTTTLRENGALLDGWTLPNTSIGQPPREVWACAGSMTDFTTGLTQLAASRLPMARPPDLPIARSRRRPSDCARFGQSDQESARSGLNRLVFLPFLMISWDLAWTI